MGGAKHFQRLENKRIENETKNLLLLILMIYIINYSCDTVKCKGPPNSKCKGKKINSKDCCFVWDCSEYVPIYNKNKMK